MNMSTFGTTQHRTRAAVPVAAGSEIRFRVNGNEYPSSLASRRNHLSMSSESIFDSLKFSAVIRKREDSDEPQVRTPRRREAFLIKENKRRNRSSSNSALKRSLFSVANESSSNLARKVASSWKAHRTKLTQYQATKDEEFLSLERSDIQSGTSSLNSTKFSSTSSSVPQSPLLGSRSIDFDLASHEIAKKSQSKGIVFVFSNRVVMFSGFVP